MHSQIENQQAKQLSEKIAILPGMDKGDLIEIWNKVFPAPPPPTLRKQLIVPILAYRLQEKAYGGLSNTARKRLREIADSLARAKVFPIDKRSPEVQTGSKFIRSWGGEMHEVFATDGGYQYRGQSFKSLSSIARQITGTRWSGPAFFGLRKKA